MKQHSLFSYYTCFYVVFFSTTICIAQNTFTFDHLVKYKESFFKDSIGVDGQGVLVEKNRFKYYLTNSENNSYSAMFHEANNNLNMAWFTFYKANHLLIQFEINMDSLMISETIQIKCETNRIEGDLVSDIPNKNYEYAVLTDTLISKKAFKRYVWRAKNLKKAKRKKWGTRLFLVDKANAFHKAIFDPWRFPEKDKIIMVPNGFHSFMYGIDPAGSIKHKESLEKIYAVTKKLVIEKCN